MQNQTNQKNQSRLVGWILMSLSLLALVVMGLRTISTPDIWQYLCSGRVGIPRVDTLTSTVADTPWISSAWLYGVLAHTLWGVSPSLLILLNVVAVTGAFILLIPVARKWSGPAAVSGALLLSTWLLAPRFETRPVLLALLPAALMIRLLASGKRSAITWGAIALTQVVWTQLDASFLLGPVLVLLFALDADPAEGKSAFSWGSLSQAARSRVLSSLGFAAGILAVSVLNPYGPKLHMHLLSSLGEPVFTEWISPFSNLFANTISRHIIILALLVGAGGLVSRKGKLPTFVTAIAIVGAVLVVRSARQVELFTLLSFPFAALSLQSLGDLAVRMGGEISKKTAFKWAAPGLIALIALSTIFQVSTNRLYARQGSIAHFGLGVADDAFPTGALELIQREDFPQQIINTIRDGSWISYNAPKIKVFIDSRTDLHTGVALERYQRLCNGDADTWKAVLQEYKPSGAIINCLTREGTALFQLLNNQTDWRMVYMDGTAALFVHNSPSNAHFLNSMASTQKGLDLLEADREALSAAQGGLIKPTPPPRLVGAGSVFMQLQRHSEARAVYQLLNRTFPYMATAPLHLGISEVQLGETESAVIHLRQATAKLPKNPMSWLWLWRACNLDELPHEGELALQRAQHLNPELAKRFVKTYEPTTEK